MKFTFGIITGQINRDFYDRIMQFRHSLNWLNIYEYEVLIVGPKIEPLELGPEHTYFNEPEKVNKFCGYHYIQFDEKIKPNWITRKKNILAEEAKYDNIVFLHDYVVLGRDWFRGFLEFGGDWDVCMTRIDNLDGTRFRDWITWDDPDFGGPGKIYEKWCPNGLICNGGPTLVDYSYKKTHLMYTSGTYFIAKKQFMLENPLDESLSWGEGEDVEWSLRVRNKWNYRMNHLSSVKLLKQK